MALVSSKGGRSVTRTLPPAATNVLLGRGWSDDRAIEDTQTATLDASGTEIYIIANPGEGLAEPAFRAADGTLLATVPKPVRDYDSVEFAVEKRFANSWYLRGSYLWSRLFGNYAGLSQSDENGRTSPNVGRLYDTR